MRVAVESACAAFPRCEDRSDNILADVRGLDGRSEGLPPGGKSGLLGSGWLLTATGREARESATEKIPPVGRLVAPQVRVKWCGKSAPQSW